MISRSFRDPSQFGFPECLRTIHTLEDGPSAFPAKVTRGGREGMEMNSWGCEEKLIRQDLMGHRPKPWPV